MLGIYCNDRPNGAAAGLAYLLDPFPISLPRNAMRHTQGHYSFGNWLECDVSLPEPRFFRPECYEKSIHTSPGVFGYYPLIDRYNRYWMQVVYNGPPIVGCIDGCVGVCTACLALLWSDRFGMVWSPETPTTQPHNPTHNKKVGGPRRAEARDRRRDGRPQDRPRGLVR